MSRIQGKARKLYQKPSPGPLLLGCRMKPRGAALSPSPPCSRLDRNGFTGSRPLRPPEETGPGGAPCPQRTVVHGKAGRWGAEVTETGSPVLLLPRSTVYRGCNKSGCKDEFNRVRKVCRGGGLCNTFGLGWDLGEMRMRGLGEQRLALFPLSPYGALHLRMWVWIPPGATPIRGPEACSYETSSTRQDSHVSCVLRI